MELPRPSGGSAEFSLEGRFSLRHEERNYYGRISWRHADELDIILLSSSFGQGMAEMTVDEKGARLVLGDGRMREAPDAEALMSRVVGYPLSMKRLADWISGRGRSGGDDDVDRDAIGRLRRLRREGWIVD
jgi:outer membrane biogenesis lipoprotein LolB